jgi:Spy/CpxP family protein refolding chaperone
MKKKLAVTTSLTVASLFLLCSVVLASPGFTEGRKAEMFKRAAFTEVMEQLNLTDQQKAQLADMRYEMRHKKIEIVSKLKLKKLELRHELGKEEINKRTIDKIAGEIKALKANMVDLKIEKALKFRSILTAEQVKKLQTLKNERPPFHREGLHHGDGPESGHRW